MILGLDDAVGCAAFARDVTVFKVSFIPSWEIVAVVFLMYLQVDEFSLVVFHVCGGLWGFLEVLVGRRRDVG